MRKGVKLGSLFLAVVSSLVIACLSSCGGGGGGGGGSGNSTPTPTPPSTFAYAGAYAAPVALTYTDKLAGNVSATAIPGQVQLLARPNVSAATIQSIVTSHGGTLLTQLPLIGYYLVGVTPGAEAAFITAMNADPNVALAVPHGPTAVSSDVVDLRGTLGSNGALPTVPNLSAQVGTGTYLYINDDFVNNALPCGPSTLTHGGGVDFGASTNLSGTGQQLNVFADRNTGIVPTDIAAATTVALTDMTFHGTGRAVINMSQQGAWRVNGVALLGPDYAQNEANFLAGIANNLNNLSDAALAQSVIVVSAGNGVGNNGTAGVDLSPVLQQLHRMYPRVFGNGPHMIVVGSGSPTTRDQGYNFSSVDTDPTDGTPLVVRAPARNVPISSTGCTASGTSFAAPEVSNLIAQLLAANSTADVGQVTRAFMQAVRANGLAMPTFQAVNQILNPSLTITTSGTGTGSVVSGPAGTSCGLGCQTFLNGTVVTLTATPTSGSLFAGWSGACSGTGTCTVTLTANTTVNATFNLNPNANLNVINPGTGTGTFHFSIVSGSGGTSCGLGCLTFARGSVVTLTASPNSGSVFAGWSGGGCSGTGSCTVTLSADTTVNATFNLPAPPVNLSVLGAGSGTGTFTTSVTGTSCGVGCITFPSGTVVTVSATPNSGSTFAGWSGGGCSGTGTCTVTLTSNTTITATFNVTQTGSGSFSGAWVGTWSKPSFGFCAFENFNLTLTLVQSGNSLSGGYSAVVTGTDPNGICPDSVGTVKSDSVAFGSVTGNSFSVTMSGGTVFSGSMSGNTLSGTGGTAGGSGPFNVTH